MDSLKNLRSQVFSEVSKRNQLKESAYKNFYKTLSKENDGVVFISSEQLRSLNIDERVTFDNGVEFVKISENKNKMVFHTVMVEGGTFSEHFHDWVEICTVLKGQLIETCKGNRDSIKIYKEGERSIYDKGEKHSMHVNEYTLLEVTFIKDII